MVLDPLKGGGRKLRIFHFTLIHREGCNGRDRSFHTKLRLRHITLIHREGCNGRDRSFHAAGL